MRYRNFLSPSGVVVTHTRCRITLTTSQARAEPPEPGWPALHKGAKLFIEVLIALFLIGIIHVSLDPQSSDRGNTQFERTFLVTKEAEKVSARLQPKS